MALLDEFLAARATDKRYDEELWRFVYESHPYLKNVPQTDLDARYRGLEYNLAFLLDEARDAPPERCAYVSSWWWLKKRVQMIAEYETRKQSLPDRPDLPPARTEPPFSPRFANECSFVVRYGDAAWLNPMLEEGAVRLAPAVSYENEGLSAAQQDNELEKPHYSLGDGVRIIDSSGHASPIIGDVRHVRPAVANYYVLCAANEFDRRLFDLFRNTDDQPADACVVIWEPDTFAARLENATRDILRGWYFHHNPVQYFDPRALEPGQRVDAGMNKDFAFAHQREYRFLWMPFQGGAAAGYLNIKLGPLGDIAGLFAPDGSCLAGRER